MMAKDTKYRYTYHTSDKSILDKIHDGFWNNCASFLADYLPYITPNMITIAGVFPIYLLLSLYVNELISVVSVYLLLTPSLVFYLNMDAIDGKLARLTNRSSPFGQMLDHGCDAIALGCILFMIFGNITSDIYHGILFSTLMFTYMTQMLCNLTEYYTGSMIVSIGKCSTTELVYLSAFGSLILFALHVNNLVQLAVTIQLYGMIACNLGSIWFSYKMVISLLNPIENNIKKGTNIVIKSFSVFDILHYILTCILLTFITYMSGYSIHELIMLIIYLSSSIIDIIFTNGTKLSPIAFDNIILLLHFIKTFMLFFGFEYVSLIIDFICLFQIIVNKMMKRNFIQSYMKI